VTAAHLDYEALADFAEGILDDATATSAEAHLADCADCRMRAAEVAEVSRVLADAPIPPMPAHLVDRLDAAIAAEAASHVPTHRHARRFQLVAAAAAAVVAVGGGAVAVRTVMEDGNSNSASSSQPPVEEPSRSHADGSTQKPQVLGSVPYTVLRTGTNYTTADLAPQVAASLAKPALTGHRPMSAADDSTRGCVARVSGTKVPLFVDSATYEGRPATVIALPAGDVHDADVWVVGSACSAADTDLIAHRHVAR
jgi:hypothetical protein